MCIRDSTSGVVFQPRFYEGFSGMMKEDSLPIYNWIWLSLIHIFDYLFWLGEITWEHYHKVSFKQPRGSDMLWACITFFILSLIHILHSFEQKSITDSPLDLKRE